MKMAKVIASVVALLLALSWLATLAQAAAKFETKTGPDNGASAAKPISR